MFIATIDGKEVELKASDLKPKEGYAIITPDNVPDGYYTQKAFNQKLENLKETFEERIKTAEKNVREKLRTDPDFNKDVLNRNGVSLDDNGKPKGLKPEIDIEELKRNTAKQVKEAEEAEKAELRKKLDSFINKGLRSTIAEGASKIGIDEKYLQPLVEGGDPYLVKELSDKFAYNDEIGDYALKDQDGTFAVDGNGFVTTQKFFEKNQEKFKHMLKDQRQRGSNFSGQGKAGMGSPKGNPAKWKLDQKLKYIEEHGKEGYEKAINNYSEPERIKQSVA